MSARPVCILVFWAPSQAAQSQNWGMDFAAETPNENFGIVGLLCITTEIYEVNPLKIICILGLSGSFEKLWAGEPITPKSPYISYLYTEEMSGIKEVSQILCLTDFFYWDLIASKSQKHWIELRAVWFELIQRFVTKTGEKAECE